MSDQAAPPPLDVLLARREWVRRFARTLARDDASADDLEQDAWLAAVEHPPRHVDAPTGWLRRVLVRRAIDVGVEGRRRDARERAASRPEASPASVDVVAAAESHRRVVEAVLALDEPYKTTVLLRFFDGLPPRDVAARMGVPVETVRARVRRACERLRERLDEEHGGRRAAWLAPLLADRAPDDVPPPTVGGRPAAAYVGAATAALVAILVIAWLRPSDDAHGRSVAAAAAARGGKPAASRVAQRGRDARSRAPAAAETESPADEDASKVAPSPAAPAVVDPKAPHEFTVSVVDERGAPVAGVRVRIDPAEMKDELDAVSDERGRAKFEVVGGVRSAAAKPHAADGRAWRPKRRTVVVPAGATRVECVVAPGAWIRGRARLEDGSPYAWAEVVAIERGRTVASTFAAEDGAFELAVPETGAWDVSLTGMSHEVFGTTNSPTGRVTQVMDRGRGLTDGEANCIGSGRVDVELTAREPSGVDTLRLLARTADGRPLAGVPIRVDARTATSTFTDADGRLVVENVPNCRVRVNVAMGPRDPRPWEDSGFAPPVGALQLRPGAGESVIEFQAARPIRGRVVIPDDLKRRDPAHPLPVIVRLQVDGQSVSLGWPDADGRFTVLAPSTSKGPFEASADARSADGRLYRASVMTTPGAQDVVLALSTNDPPPAPAPAPSKPFIAEPK